MANRLKRAETTAPVSITWKYCPLDLNLADLGGQRSNHYKDGKRKMVSMSRLTHRQDGVATAAKAEQHQRHR